MADEHQLEAAELRLSEFILQVRLSGGQLDRGWKSDHYHIGVFQSSVQAILLQFRAPDLALIVFTARPEREDLTVDIVFDEPLSAVREELPKKLENYEPLSLDESLGNGKVSLREFLENETKFLLGDAVKQAVYDATGFRPYPPDNVAVYHYPVSVALMNVSSCIGTRICSSEG